MSKNNLTFSIKLKDKTYTAHEPLAKDFKNYISMLRKLDSLSQEETLAGGDVDVELEFVVTLFDGITVQDILDNMSFKDMSELRGKYSDYIYGRIPQSKN